MIRILCAALALAALCRFAPASAHVTLEVTQAPTGSFYKATFRVPHGCDGAATVRFGIRIPDGVTSVKPQPKPGWEVVTTKEGAQVREVSWRGLLDDSFYDEFVMQVRLPAAPDTTVTFPVVQACERGEARWSPTLRLVPAAAPAPEHRH